MSLQPAPPALPDYDETFCAYLGLEVSIDMEAATAAASLAVHTGLFQPMGIVHGGIYAAVAEELVSTATAHFVMPSGQIGLGQSNLTHFLRPVSSGTVEASARAVHRGRTSWVWAVEMRDSAGRLCATSTVTMAIRPRPTSAPPGTPPATAP